MEEDCSSGLQASHMKENTKIIKEMGLASILIQMGESTLENGGKVEGMALGT